jgi:hypothetical protein
MCTWGPGLVAPGHGSGTTVGGTYDQVVRRARVGALTFDRERMPPGDSKTAWQRTAGVRRLVIL